MKQYEPKPGQKKKLQPVTLEEFTPAERAVIHRYKKALDRNSRITHYYETQHKVVNYENTRNYDKK
jgi:hypothetical protein